MSLLYCSQGHENARDSRFCRQCGEPLVPAPIGGTIAGQLLGSRYRLHQELGQGGFGRTYLAEDTNRFGELCVLKEFAPQVQGDQALQKAEELFAREAGILYKLQHPQIPRFRELFRAEFQGKGRLFLVQDYVSGETYQALLQQRLYQGKSFTEAELTQLLLQLLPVLDYIHGCGVIHRDISPDNLIHRSQDGLPVLIDFGGVKQVAVAVASQMHLAAPPIAATRLGKVGYAPAEQMERGEVFPHSDLYALAVTLLVLRLGREPLEVLGGQWQQALSPSLVGILERMLSPYPHCRYQSAREVLQALGGSAIPDYPVTQAPPPQPMGPSYPATLPIGPPNAALTQAPASYPPSSPRKSLAFPALALLVFITLGLGGGWWLGQRWFGSPGKPSPSPTATASGNGASAPEYSAAEQARKRAIEQRRQTLEIDSQFFVRLVNQAFYAKHPELAGRQLSKGKPDETLRADWDQLATQTLDRLQTISPASRARMGSYSADDIRQRQAAVNQVNLSSRALNDLADGQFFFLFPEQPRNQNLLDQPIGQVWQAIASDQLKAIQAGTALERIKFPTGEFSQQVNGALKPGEGRAYTASLAKGQTLQLKLQAPDQSTLLSLYPPTSKSPPLLSDSRDTGWTGKLTEAGLYEIVVINNTAQTLNYSLDLAAAEEISSPNPSPSPSPSPTAGSPGEQKP